MKDITYNFKERSLGPDFAKEKVKEFKRIIDTSLSFTVVSMPGVGVSYFLKYLACQTLAHFIYIDLYNLPTLNQHEFYRMFLRDLGGNPDNKSDEQVFIESKQILKKLASKYDKIVIIFSRFDQLKKDLDENFLSNLQSLTTMTDNPIVLIFTSILPLYEIAPEAVKGGNLPFYSKILYFTPFSKPDLLKLFTMDHSVKAHPDIEKIMEFAGGHKQLLNVFINSHKANNLLLDKFVTLQLRDLLSYLDYQQKKDVQKIALGKTPNEVDEYLLGTGYVQNVKTQSSNVKYKLFSPILEQYIKTHIPHKLPVKEKLLFNLLKKNNGNVVSKEEIFQEVWEENDQNATDWALDALVYRLRNHPFIKSHGYVIESQKKVGYSLVHP